MSDAAVPAPGEFIREELHQRGWGQADLARILSRPLPTINGIIQGKKAITPETAVGLGLAFETGAEIWMRREAAYRLSLVDKEDPSVTRLTRLYQMAPVKEMEKRGWISRTSSPDTLEQELCNFFEIESISDDLSLAVAARSPLRSLALTPSQRAWCYRGKRLAQTLEADPFSETQLRLAVPEMRKLAAYADRVKELPRLLASLGIRLVVIEQLPQSKIDGAAFWLNDSSPVIVLSLRYDRIDWFWHTLFHELSHILNRDALSIDDDMYVEMKNKNEIEVRADQEAADMLIPRSKMESFILRVKPIYSKQRIIQFAHRMEIHPGVVTGQLQKLGEIPYSANRELLVKVRNILTPVALTDGWGTYLPAV